MTSPLFPCPHCARHVRALTPTCPFCDGPLGEAPTPRPRPPGRLSRAGLLALGALAGAVACETAVPVYGAPAPPDGRLGQDPGSQTDAGPRTDAPPQLGVPVYGAPAPPTDAAPDAGGGCGPGAGAADAGADGGSPCADADARPAPLPVPVYGAPSPRLDGGGS
jgi:hypothetical protein